MTEAWKTGKAAILRGAPSLCNSCYMQELHAVLHLEPGLLLRNVFAHALSNKISHLVATAANGASFSG